MKNNEIKNIILLKKSDLKLNIYVKDIFKNFIVYEAKTLSKN